ncbi:hypothetical protein [Novosphingobium soli]|uniref:Uncharacterized protein n=1 Tax=Novosphingobium soli TaxID=574956 RepID=A0ABV6CXC4_9SPHN
MHKKFEIGALDLDITLRDEALDPLNSPARRMVANAAISVEPFDAYYSVRELRGAVQAVHEGEIGAKRKLTRVLSTECDDFQRCIYYQLAGRGVVQMLDVLEWLEELLARRSVVSHDLFREGTWPAIMVNPYVAAQPDGPLVSADPNFEEGPSWYLDPDLSGVIEE